MSPEAGVTTGPKVMYAEVHGTSRPIPMGSLKNTTVIVGTWLTPGALVLLDIEVTEYFRRYPANGEGGPNIPGGFTERY